MIRFIPEEHTFLTFLFSFFSFITHVYLSINKKKKVYRKYKRDSLSFQSSWTSHLPIYLIYRWVYYRNRWFHQKQSQILSVARHNVSHCLLLMEPM